MSPHAAPKTRGGHCTGGSEEYTGRSRRSQVEDRHHPNLRGAFPSTSSRSLAQVLTIPQSIQERFRWMDDWKVTDGVEPGFKREIHTAFTLGFPSKRR